MLVQVNMFAGFCVNMVASFDLFFCATRSKQFWLRTKLDKVAPFSYHLLILWCIGMRSNDDGGAQQMISIAKVASFLPAILATKYSFYAYSCCLFKALYIHLKTIAFGLACKKLSLKVNVNNKSWINCSTCKCTTSLNCTRHVSVANKIASIR